MALFLPYNYRLSYAVGALLYFRNFKLFFPGEALFGFIQLI
jgi:hypothetical protein